MISIESLINLARDDSYNLSLLGHELDFFFIRKRIEILLRRTPPHLVDKYKPIYEALYARAMLTAFNTTIIN